VSSNLRGVCFDRLNSDPKIDPVQCRNGAQVLEPLQCLEMQTLNTTVNDFSDPEKTPYLCKNDRSSLPELCRDATDQ
jgi:hypothetical protein